MGAMASPRAGASGRPALHRQAASAACLCNVCSVAATAEQDYDDHDNPQTPGIITKTKTKTHCVHLPNRIHPIIRSGRGRCYRGGKGAAWAAKFRLTNPAFFATLSWYSIDTRL
jgi:hypothetical protein